MSIELVIGDMLEAFKSKEINAMMHGCNCFNNFGAGLARDIRNLYAEASRVDRATKVGDKQKLGQISIAKVSDQTIFNLYTQYGYGGGVCNTNYDAVANCLLLVRKFLEYSRFKGVVGLPYLMCCGLGGGSWAKVEYIIQQIFKGSDITIKIFKLKSLD